VTPIATPIATPQRNLCALDGKDLLALASTTKIKELASKLPSPPVRPKARNAPTLIMKALLMNSVQRLQDVLDEDPLAASFPELGIEPPLCCAVRLGCDVPVLALLVASGADVHATNSFGQTPLEVLIAKISPRGTRPQLHRFGTGSQVTDPEGHLQEVEQLLVEAGAQRPQQSPHARPGARWDFGWNEPPPWAAQAPPEPTPMLIPPVFNLPDGLPLPPFLPLEAPLFPVEFAWP
jgi:hypothetical protein